MEHKELMSEIDMVIQEELTHARVEYKNMTSGHDGHGKIREEFEEMQDEIVDFEGKLECLWRHVKGNNPSGQSLFINEMIVVSKKVIKEAVQMAAMCQRFKEDICREGIQE